MTIVQSESQSESSIIYNIGMLKLKANLENLDLTGMLEIVGVTGVVHLGQIQSGLRSAMRIAQGGHIKIRINTDMPVSFLCINSKFSRVNW